MIPSGLHVVVGWLPVARGARRRDRHDPARGVRERAPRLADSPDRRAARGDRSAPAQSHGSRAVIGLAAFLAAVSQSCCFAARNSGGRRESDAPAAAMMLMVAAALLGPLLAWPFAWLVGRPLAALQTRARAARLGQHACEPAPRTASVATPLMLAISLSQILYRQVDPPQGDARADGEAHDCRIRPPRAPDATDCQPTSRRRRGGSRVSPVRPGRSRRRSSWPRTATTSVRSRARTFDSGTARPGTRPRRRLRLAGRSAREGVAVSSQQRSRVGLANRRPGPRLARRRHAGDAASRRSPTRARSASATSSCRAPSSSGTSRNRSTTPSSSPASPASEQASSSGSCGRYARRIRRSTVVSRSDYETEHRPGRREAVVGCLRPARSDRACSARSRSSTR